MGVLAYLPYGVHTSPYKKLFDPLLWTEICEVFMKDACALLGFSVESPLSVCVNVGSISLPALLNIKQVMAQRQVAGMWNAKDELPVLSNNQRLRSVLLILSVFYFRLKLTLGESIGTIRSLLVPFSDNKDRTRIRP